MSVFMYVFVSVGSCFSRFCPALCVYVGISFVRDVVMYVCYLCSCLCRHVFRCLMCVCLACCIPFFISSFRSFCLSLCLSFFMYVLVRSFSMYVVRAELV